MIHCPNCGERTKDDILYSENLRKQGFNLSPILPVCKGCGAETTITHQCNGGTIIVLNGTCGSGKSTIAETLSARGYLGIDGDCAIQSLRHKTGRKQYEWKELINEIAHEIDILSLFGKDIVLSHVILPEDMTTYLEIFKTRKMNYHFFLLKPTYETAVTRCQSRTCHASITPEYWIKHFYDVLTFDNQVTVVDNTHMTPEETADYISANLNYE